MDKPVKYGNLTPPTPEGIKAARERIGDSMERAARRVHAQDASTWWRWENGKREMPLASWELYIIKARRVERKRAKHKEQGA